MGNTLIAAVLNGATGMACVAVAVFFARFWNESRDRLFLGLNGGFGLLGVNYGLLALLVAADERRAYAFCLRLIGLLLILISILLKDHEYVDPLLMDEHETRDVA